MNWLTLSFPGDLEREFREDQLASSMRQVRIATLLGILLYSLFGFLDPWVAPGATTALWLIRFAVVLPFCLMILGISFTTIGAKHLQLLTASGVLIPGLGIVAMIAVAPSDAGQIYYAGLILVFIFGYTFTRLRFINATITGWRSADRRRRSAGCSKASCANPRKWRRSAPWRAGSPTT
jgi:hypothetical protein